MSFHNYKGETSSIEKLIIRQTCQETAFTNIRCNEETGFVKNNCQLFGHNFLSFCFQLPMYTPLPPDSEYDSGSGFKNAATLNHATSMALLVSLTACLVVLIIFVAFVYLR